MSYLCNRKSDGAIAQLVEQRTENPCVPGSIPGGTTQREKFKRTSLFFVLCNLIKNYKNNDKPYLTYSRNHITYIGNLRHRTACASYHPISTTYCILLPKKCSKLAQTPSREQTFRSLHKEFSRKQVYSSSREDLFNWPTMAHNKLFVRVFCFTLVDTCTINSHCNRCNLSYLIISKQVLGKIFLSLQNETHYSKIL